MPEPTLEVIYERLNNLIADNKQEHAQIIVQTTKTNGEVASLSKWRERMQGGLIVLNLFVVPVMLFLLYEQLKRGLY